MIGIFMMGAREKKKGERKQGREEKRKEAGHWASGIEVEAVWIRNAL